VEGLLVRRGLIVALVSTVMGLSLGWRPAGALNVIFDDRVDWAARPNGTVTVLGDSVGYGLVKALEGWGGPNINVRLANDGWGPIRSYTLAGLHAMPEGSGDPHNVATWIGKFRAQGLIPRVALIVSGANDVGWQLGNSVARNELRIETAMQSLGTTEVVWSTITHHDLADQNAWNQALINVAARWPNLHVCDWYTVARSNPGYLSGDQVHPTPTGYRVMRDLIAGCIATSGGRARGVAAPALGGIPAAGVAGRLVNQAPARVLDTRATGAPIAAGTVRRIHVAPPGSSAAALNITSADAVGGGYLTTFPCNLPQPYVSNLNYRGGGAVAGGLIVGVDPQGDVCVFSLQTTHVIVDVQATFKPGGALGFTAQAPTRLVDTRAGARVAPGAPLQVDIGSQVGFVNLTAADATAGGYLTVYPCGGAVPLVSNVNYLPGVQAVANAATVASTGGKICITSSTPVHVIVDLAGKFAAGGASFVPAAPTRVLDTRTGVGGWQGSAGAGQVLARDLNASLPPAATGISATLTAIPDNIGYASAFPAGQAAPNASNVNPARWTATANAVSVAGRNPALVMAPSHGYFLLDVTGWWQ
jgi:lysophospholipase L1-like esterase